LTSIEKIGNHKEKPLLLFSPLDWGLGHTTRSIPLIRELAASGCEIVVACNSIQKEILNTEIKGLQYVHLEGYDLKYGPGRLSTFVKILSQLPKILTRIKKERRWLNTFIAQNHVDGIISDNRYGLSAVNKPSIFITHQLNINSGLGRFADNFAQSILYRFINKFTECWVPDFEPDANIAGYLSNPRRLPSVPVKYIGCLSRFDQCKDKTSSGKLLIILSGPEPQRTLFEKKILDDLRKENKRATLIRGLPLENVKPEPIEYVKILNYAGAAELNQLACSADLIICRAGYTGIMDMMKLRKKMVIVPTPGQGEQEYLAKHLTRKHLAVSVTQSQFSIRLAEKLVSGFTFQHLNQDMEAYKIIVNAFVNSITSSPLSLKH
jgi:UDP:flavonoid glycosyltransferase YjiC (YdhE family)